MKIAIIWATWAVGVEMINCLNDFNIPISELRLWASARSVWKVIDTKDLYNLKHLWTIEVQEVSDDFFDNLDYALFSAGWDNSKKYIPIAVKKWVVCIDNSSAFRYDDNVPLVITSINASSIKDSKIIANPNCTTAIALMPLYPIYKKYWIKKMIVSTYQATSWAGAKWMDELLENTKKYFSWKKAIVEHFAHNIAFNVIPHIDTFQENWYTKEEMKVSWETKKIFNDKNIKVSCTAVRIPTLRAHSESIVLETEKKVDIEDIKNILTNYPWVKLVDNIEKKEYPMPKNATWNYDVEVWRIRKNLVFWDYWLELFVSWDQLLRWAALNAVEILDYLVKNKTLENF